MQSKRFRVKQVWNFESRIVRSSTTFYFNLVARGGKCFVINVCKLWRFSKLSEECQRVQKVFGQRTINHRASVFARRVLKWMLKHVVSQTVCSFGKHVLFQMGRHMHQRYRAKGINILIKVLTGAGTTCRQYLRNPFFTCNFSCGNLQLRIQVYCGFSTLIYAYLKSR